MACGRNISKRFGTSIWFHTLELSHDLVRTIAVHNIVDTAARTDEHVIAVVAEL